MSYASSANDLIRLIRAAIFFAGCYCAGYAFEMKLSCNFPRFAVGLPGRADVITDRYADYRACVCVAEVYVANTEAELYVGVCSERP